MLGKTETGFKVITKKPGDPIYISCSAGIIEITAEPKGSHVAIKLRTNNKDIRFHLSHDRLLKFLGICTKPS